MLPGVKTMKDFVFAYNLKHEDLDSFNEIPLDLKEMIKSFWENNWISPFDGDEFMKIICYENYLDFPDRAKKIKTRLHFTLCFGNQNIKHN